MEDLRRGRSGLVGISEPLVDVVLEEEEEGVCGLAVEVVTMGGGGRREVIGPVVEVVTAG